MIPTGTEKTTAQKQIGKGLVFLSVITLVLVPFFLVRCMNVDFPCYYITVPRLGSANANSHLASCISLYPRHASGAYPYFMQASNEDQMSLKMPAFWYGTWIIEKQAEVLIVNGQHLQPNEAYKEFKWFPSLNPWLLETAEITITNYGSQKKAGLPDTLYSEGEIIEDSSFNPLGVIILFVGAALYLGKEALKT